MEIATIGILCATMLVIVLSEQIMRYKLKKENIEADAMVKAEEIRGRNQLEIERLMLQGQNQKDAGQQERDSFTEDLTSVREKIHT